MKQMKKSLYRYLIYAALIIRICPLHGVTANDIHYYFWANYQAFHNNGPQAHLWYKKLLENNPPIYIYKGYVTFLFAANAHAHIVQLMPHLESPFENDIDIQLIFAQALQHTGNTKASHEKFIKLSNQFKTNQATIFQAAHIYVNQKEPENALKIIDTLLNSSPKRSNNFIFHFLKAQIYVQLQEPEKALAAVTACLEMHKQFDKGWLLFALLQEQKGELTQAISGYTTFLEVSQTKNPAIQNHLLQLAYKQKLTQPNSQSAAIDQSSFAQALKLFEHKNYKGALEQVNLYLEKTPDNPEARLLKIQLLSALNLSAQAADTIKAWILEKPNAPEWYQSLHLLCKAGLTHQKAIAILEDISKKQPTIITPHLYLADLHARIGNADTALSYHTKALPLTDCPVLKTKILFAMGQLYYLQQKFELAQKVLEQGNALNQNFPPLLNLLAYHYATQSKDLKKAEELINMVLAQSTNPHFLDTKALILYKQKQYKKALHILQAIAPQAPDDFSLLKHLAKTQYRLGQKSKAKKTIKLALKVAHQDHEKNKANFIITQWNKK